MLYSSQRFYVFCVCVCRYYVHVSFISNSNLKVLSLVINCYSPSKYLLNPQLKEDEMRSQIHPNEHVKMEGWTETNLQVLRKQCHLNNHFIPFDPWMIPHCHNECPWVIVVYLQQAFLDLQVAPTLPTRPELSNNWSSDSSISIGGVSPIFSETWTEHWKFQWGIPKYPLPLKQILLKTACV